MQGTHQVAQKSTRTALPLSPAIFCWSSSGVTATTWRSAADGSSCVGGAEGSAVGTVSPSTVVGAEGSSRGVSALTVEGSGSLSSLAGSLSQPAKARVDAAKACTANV